MKATYADILPYCLSVYLKQEGASQRDICGFGGACRSLALYEALPSRVRELVDAAGFGEFIRTLTRSRNDHVVLVALADRWRDTTNTFHLPVGEMTVTPADFAAITGLRVGGEPIPFDSGIQNDRVALEWFLGEAPRIEEGMARYEPLTEYLNKEVTTEQEVERMARACLLYLFGATLYPNRRSKVHLSYLPALRNLRTASCFDWGGAALGTAYAFLGDSSRTGQSTAGYWRVWVLWAYEVLQMYPPQCKHPNLSTLPRALIWSKKNMGSKEGRGDLNAFRLYLDDLRASQINWDPWRVAGAEPEYLARSRAITASRVELERFTQPDAELTCYLRPEMDYAAYQRNRLAGPLGIRAFRDVRSEAHGAVEERRATGERSRGGEGRARQSASISVKRRTSRDVMEDSSSRRSGKSSRDTLGACQSRATVRDRSGMNLTYILIHAPLLNSFDDIELPLQVPNEWVNEGIRRMLALENVVRRAASSLPLELRYQAPSPPRAQELLPRGLRYTTIHSCFR
ncbi:hypothetical protein RHMOL_Rhmol04G0167400 [Rhododendron molle]|uniref:Uncharacterized protein n=1 Tax=Rhododendron molle TaxID=49168 RepID=A0ACC0P3G1_RHOML|nr:hypothetical protein RHMOL_Rhmol04G0167400 [Rhododendron molle]